MSGEGGEEKVGGHPGSEMTARIIEMNNEKKTEKKMEKKNENENEKKNELKRNMNGNQPPSSRLFGECVGSRPNPTLIFFRYA